MARQREGKRVKGFLSPLLKSQREGWTEELETFAQGPNANSKLSGKEIPCFGDDANAIPPPQQVENCMAFRAGNPFAVFHGIPHLFKGCSQLGEVRRGKAPPR